MRQSDPPVHYLVGTPKGRLSKLEAALAERPWQEVREGITVKLLPQDGRMLRACAERRRASTRNGRCAGANSKQLWKRLPRIAPNETLDRDGLLMKLGAAASNGPRPGAW